MPLIEELDTEVETLDSLEGLVVTPTATERLTESAAAIRLAVRGRDRARLAPVGRLEACRRRAEQRADPRRGGPWRLLAGLAAAYAGYANWRET